MEEAQLEDPGEALTKVTVVVKKLFRGKHVAFMSYTRNHLSAMKHSIGFVPKSDADMLANYRPISNLPFLFKILEKAAASQLCNYLQQR
ncbi:hypothetical protein L3Q82_011553 [Scortum barcoo]|uniref:Uncharacterized protein n=1 Tax=Scortum barcoo TaxID=214431 RepID=A0ACB8W699_9TELE|nr:hypothetical protein L3Q82_011553 [Scortum barcoo]